MSPWCASIRMRIPIRQPETSTLLVVVLVILIGTIASVGLAVGVAALTNLGAGIGLLLLLLIATSIAAWKIGPSWLYRRDMKAGNWLTIESGHLQCAQFSAAPGQYRIDGGGYYHSFVSAGANRRAANAGVFLVLKMPQGSVLLHGTYGLAGAAKRGLTRYQKPPSTDLQIEIWPKDALKIGAQLGLW